jgi:Domain of unknown function (DUF4386)
MKPLTATSSIPASAAAHGIPTAYTPTSMQRIAMTIGLLLVAVLAFAPVAILGPAIGWPASLGNPAAEQLTAIAAKPQAVTLGYALYGLYSLAIAVVAIVVTWRVNGLRGPLAAMIVTFGALSAFARLIGILRWLTVMPKLATAHAAGDATTRTSVELIFTAITSYGGGIGELLGVALFGGLWLLIAMAAAIRNRSLPTWLSVFGLLAALLQLTLFLPALGIVSPVPIAAAVIVFLLWLATFAINLARS